MKRTVGVIEGNHIDDKTDTDLWQAFRHGDEEAFLLLYRRHQGSVFRFALHMSGSRETADEVTQEVFLSLLADNCRYDPSRGSLEAFLVGAARNQVRRQERLSRLIASPPAGEPAVDPVTVDPGLGHLRRAILDLPRKYRETIVLCDIEELSYEETAQRLQCAVGTVRSRLHRARTLLTEKLRGEKKMAAAACEAHRPGARAIERKKDFGGPGASGVSVMREVP